MGRPLGMLGAIVGVAVLVIAARMMMKPDIPSSKALEALHHEAGHEEKPELTDEEIDARLTDFDARLARQSKNAVLFEERLDFALAYAPEEAVAQCKAVLAKDRDHYHALEHITVAYLSLGQLKKALHYAAQTLRVRPGADSRMLVAKVYETQAQFDKAKALYRQILDKNKRHEGAREALERL